MEGTVQLSEGLLGFFTLAVLIDLLIASSSSKLSQHFHLLCGFMPMSIALALGVQLTAKERVKDAGPESSTATTPH